jgi:hypothetical protein
MDHAAEPFLATPLVTEVSEPDCDFAVPIG